MYNACPLLDNFIEFGRKKDAKDNENQILSLLGSAKGGKGDSEEQPSHTMSYNTPNKSDTNEGSGVPAQPYQDIVAM